MALEKRYDGKKKWNLLLVIQNLFGGGAEVIVEKLCKYVNKDLFNISVCHLKERGERGEELLRKGYEVFGVSKPRIFKVDYLTFVKLRRIIRRKNIDIIHSHSTDALVDSSLCKLSLPRVGLVHTFHFGNYPHYKKRYLLLEKIFCRVPNKLVAVGNEQKRSIQETFKILDRRILTIWNGVEKSEPSVDPELMERFSQTNKVIIGCMSTFIKQKGLSYLLDVAFLLKKRTSNFLFVVVGDGPLRCELEIKCRQLGLEDTVFFLGWIRDAASKVLPLFDIFFQPSLWEAMSVVVLEAMAAGKPVVVTDVGENRHIIEDREDGLIVEPKNVDEMANALQSLVDNLDLRIKFGMKARQKVEQYCSVDKMAREYERLYAEVLLR